MDKATLRRPCPKKKQLVSEERQLSDYDICHRAMTPRKSRPSGASGKISTVTQPRRYQF